MDKSRLESCFETLVNEARGLYLFDEVPVLECIPSPLHFHRNYVCANLPVLIKNCLETWPALKKWSPQYLREHIGDKSVSVAVTPNGMADAVLDNLFVLPEERLMKFEEFLDSLNEKKENEILYVQKQNSNMTDDFSDLLKDIGSEVDWASQAFDKSPDAVNFWMGDERAITSMHRDHYENIYCVISGEKTFTLIPPTDLPYVPYERYHVGTYHQNLDSSWTVLKNEDESVVPWVAINPLDPDLGKYPQYEKAHSVKVTVKAGEILYLPSLWFHHVQQSHGCIAVNYWYDMEFDIKYSYYKFLEEVVSIAR